ncbi:hypothetical protein AB0B31_10835 [Catellatospora citrea]|uniref:hypothetical protein n=1 Tax=Catellatospora citrea TaxID=53366 RepID=UPI0033FD5DDF
MSVEQSWNAVGDVMVYGEHERAIGIELYHPGEGLLVFHQHMEPLTQIRVSLAQAGAIASALLQVLLVANDYEELAADGAVRSATVELAEQTAFTITVLYRDVVEYGEIETAADGTRYCQVEDGQEAYAVELLIIEGGSRLVLHVDLAEANTLHTNLAGLLFIYARRTG